MAQTPASHSFAFPPKEIGYIFELSYRSQKCSETYLHNRVNGDDMDALSPRSTNVMVRSTPTMAINTKSDTQQHKTVTKSAAPNQVSKPKDHAPPPPAIVHEPPSNGPNESKICYKTGKLLGKGGFAVCYEGTILPSKTVYALKVVKSVMSVKRMEDKVSMPIS